MRFGAEAAWEKLSRASKVLIARGKSVKEWDPRMDDKALILKNAIGPSGNLRAPSLVIGDVILVGFNQSMYEKYAGGA